MKKTRRWVALTLVLALVLSLTACSTGGGESSSSQAPTSTTEPSSSADSGTEVSSETDTTGTGADLTSYPREETLYLGGQQWGTPVSNNPLAANQLHLRHPKRQFHLVRVGNALHVEPLGWNCLSAFGRRGLPVE